MNNLTFFSEDSDRRSVVLYLVLVKSFFSHNASYYPAQGYGKSVTAECSKPLFYIRSQGKHHEIRDYRQQTESRYAYGIQNTAFLAMVRSSRKLFDEEYRTSMGRMQQNGEVADKKEKERLGEKLAHLSCRANNVELFRELCETAFDQSLADNFAALKKLIPDAKKHQWNKVRIQKEIAAERAVFKKLQNPDAKLYVDVLSNLMRHRSEAASEIRDALAVHSLSFIKPSFVEDGSFIYFELYPGMGKQQLKNSDNYKEGLTNLLIGFFGALVNHNALQQGLHSVVSRDKVLVFYDRR